MVRHLPVNREVPGSNPAAASFFCANKKEGNAAGRAGPWASSTTCSPPCPAGGTARHVIDIYSAQKEKNVSYNHKSACVPVVRLLPVHQGGRGFELREEQFFCKKNKGRGRQLVDFNHGPGRHVFTGTPSWWDRIAMSSRLGPEGGSA